MAKTSEELSLNKTIKMHGVEIKKMPCGKYFEALQTLKDLPEDFIKELSQGEELKLSEMFTTEKMMDLVTKLLIIAPKFLFEFLSKLLNVDEEVIENQLSPAELLEICIKFWEVNKLESFFVQMKPVLTKMIGLIGFREQLPSVLKSE